MRKSIRTRLRERNTVRRGRDAGTAARTRDETGASLIMALMALTVSGLLVGGLASWTASDLNNTVHFNQSRSAQYALSSATQAAVQSIRYSPLLGVGQTLNASPPTACSTGATPPSGNVPVTTLATEGDQVAVWCSTAWNPTSAVTRIVTLSACLTSVDPISGLTSDGSSAPAASAQSSAGTCASRPGLQTVVTFDDYSSNNPGTNYGICTSTCGSGMTVNSWTTGVANPTVASLSSSQGPVTGGTTLTVTGTGFVPGPNPCGSGGPTKANFVAANPSSNIILRVPASNVCVSSPTSLSLPTPVGTTATSYYVVITTPSGTSSAGPQFTYQPVVPTVTSATTPSGDTQGSAAGGSTLNITGTGFLSNLAGDSTTVTFVDTANAAVSVRALHLTVNSSTSITATTPSISQDSTYYVVVTTAPGGSSGTAAAPIFTFVPLTPVVGSVSPTSGGSQQVTITGIGFVSGSTTVQLVPVSGFANTLNATNVSVTNSTTLTATVPTGGSNGTAYYVEVTTTSGGASCPIGGCSSNNPTYGY